MAEHCCDLSLQFDVPPQSSARGSLVTWRSASDDLEGLPPALDMQMKVES